MYADTITNYLKSDGVEPGSKQFLALYPVTLSKVIEEMNHSETKEAEAMADKWNREGAPDAMKKRYLLCSRCCWSYLNNGSGIGENFLS